MHSTFNYSFNSFEPSLLLVSDTDHCLLKTWRRKEKEMGPLSHTHTIVVGDTAALAKHCCRADRHH